MKCDHRDSVSSGLYVDVENLGADGQSIIGTLIDYWPCTAPKPIRMTLFVEADRIELWRVWAESQFPDMSVNVNGTQHFSMSSTKNSSDIAMAIKAMADLLLKRVSHVVIVSHDSDFISLYCAIRDEPAIPLHDGKPPFVWVVTDRPGLLSETVKKYFPANQTHVISVKSTATQKVDKTKSPKPLNPSWQEMAKLVVEKIPVGQFKSTDFKPLLKDQWPRHKMANAGGAAFGIEFKNNIWPELKKMGAKISNPGKKPVKYEMTQEAKARLKQSP